MFKTAFYEKIKSQNKMNYTLNSTRGVQKQKFVITENMYYEEKWEHAKWTIENNNYGSKDL